MSLKNQIEKLLNYRNDEYPITSVYLKLGPSDRVNFKYKGKLKNLIKVLIQDREEKKLSESAVESVERDIKKITNLIDDDNQLSECRGICIFTI